ncbi:MAG: hypothetical protein WD022_03115 [Balneolaceae bacterium]
MRSIQYGLAVLLLFSFLSEEVQARQDIDRREVTVSNLGVSFTNRGTIGNPNISSIPSGLPSLEYPKGSGTEHLFEAGIWLGAKVDGQTRVSTSAVTNSSGYSPGVPGFEFTDVGQPFTVLSSLEDLEDNENYSSTAISHEDFVVEFTDKNTSVGNTPIRGHDNPLGADVKMESYNWNFGFSQALTIIKYEITNNGSANWEDFYFGLYSDMVVRNVETTLEFGTNFFNKGGMGWIDDLYALYVFDRGSKDVKRNTYSASIILGSEYKGIEFHPRRADEVIAAGLPVPNLTPTFWLYSGADQIFSRPNDDLDRYEKLSEIWPQTDDPAEAEQAWNRLREDGAVITSDGGPVDGSGNFIQLNTLGPFPTVETDETITIYISFVAAEMPDDFQPNHNDPNDDYIPANVVYENADFLDNDSSRVNLRQNIEWAYRLFDGEENDDGTRTRFLVPEPPLTPRMHVELDEEAVRLYWDGRAESSVDPVTEEEDFAGYKIYRSQLGDDLSGVITSNAKPLREWDLEGDGQGFDTGFDEIRLDSPISFPGDPTEYTYRYEISGMLSGWQYLFSVSAFDRGDDRTPPLETSVTANAVRVFPGTPANENFDSKREEFKVGVYPNPYRINAAWDGSTPFTRKIMFYNLPAKAEIRVYTLAGEIVAELTHDSENNSVDARWFDTFSSDNRIMPGGERAWDLLSEANQNLTTGLYLFTVHDKDSGEVQQGKFAVIK